MAITYTDNGGGAPNGSKLEFTFTFPVIQTEDTKVALNSVVQATTKYAVDLSSNPTKITFNSNNIDSTVQESTGAPKTGVTVRVFRRTEVGKSTGDDAPKAVYAAGSSIRAVDLNANTEQALYAIHELQDQPLNDTDIEDGSITSAKIKDGTIANVDVSATAAIDGTKVNPNFGSQNIATTGTVNGVSATELAILDGLTVSTTELNKLDGVTSTTAELNILDGVTATATEINTLDGVTSNVQTQLNAKQPLDAELTELATMASDTASSLADLTAAEVQTLDGVTANTNEINKLDGVTTSTTELNYVDGVTSNIQTQLNNKQPLNDRLTTLSGIQSTTASKLADNTGLTADLADLNELDGMAKQTTITNDDTKFPTSGAVIDYVTAQLAPIGGFEVIPTETFFPNVQPASGVVISIADAGGLVVNGSGTSTTARTINGTVVTINNFNSNFNSSTVDPGVAILVSSTGSNQVYNYHKATLKEADLLSLSGDINDFAERYRVVNGEPTSGNDEGDLIYDKIADKIKVFDSTTNSFKLVDAIGEFKFLYLCPTNSTGAPTFNGQINTYDLREGSSSGTLANIQNAAQLIVSIDGVIQKPNTGTSQPSEGFAMVDTNTIIFGSNLAIGANVFIIQIGAEVGIGVPGDNQVSTDKLQNLSVTTNKLANDSVTTDKLANSIVSDITANNAKVSNQGTNLSTSTSTTTVTVASSDGTNATIGEATGSAAGVMSSAHHDKLDGIEAGATGDQTAAEIRSLVESAPNSNVFTDTDHGKLNAIENGATADQTAAEIRTLVESASDSNVFTDADHTKLNAIESGATADQTAAEIRTLVESASDSNVFTDADHTKLNNIETSATADQTASEIVALVADQTIAPSTIDMEDNEKIKLGTGDDLEIFHDGSNSRLKDVGTGVLAISGSDVHIQNSNNTQSIAKFLGGTTNSSAELYYNDSKKLETTSNGISVDGHISLADNNELRLGSADEVKISHTGSSTNFNVSQHYLNFYANGTFFYNQAGNETKASLLQNGAVELFYDGSKKLETTALGVSADYYTGTDNAQLRLGDSGDFQIYHDGSNSRIHNSTGELIFRTGSNYVFYNSDGTEKHAKFNQNGSVDLYYDNSKKLETQSSGVNVIGTLKVNGNVIASGGLGNIVEDTTPQLGGDLDFNGNNALLQGPGTASNTNWDNDAWEKIVFDNSYNANPQGPNKIVLHTQSGWHAGFGVATGELGMYSGADIAFYTNTSDSTASAKETLAKFISDGAVELYYDGSKKFETLAHGARITGSLWADGFYMDDNEKIHLGTSGADLQIYHNGTTNYADIASGQQLYFRVGGANKFYVKSDGAQFVGSLYGDDSNKIQLGNSQDLQIYHNGSNSYIDNDTGRLYIRNSSTDLIQIQALEGENSIIAYPNGQVKLLYDDSTKLETNSIGINVFGHIYQSDNEKHLLGNAQDLELYHNGSHSYINNKTGNLYLMAKSGEVGIQIVPDAAVKLRYDDVNKIQTGVGGEYGSFQALNGAGGWDGMAVGNSNIVFMGSQDSAGIWNDYNNEWMMKCDRNASTTLQYNGSTKIKTQSYGASVGDPVGDTLSGVDTITQFYAGYDTNASSTFGGVIMGSGNNGNSPFIGASRAGNQTALHLDFKTNAVNRMRIDNSGNTFINCTSDPASNNAKFAVQGGGDGAQVACFHFNSNASASNVTIKHGRAGAVSGTRTGKMIRFQNLSGTEVGTITSGISSTAYNTSSDYRLKENITNISDGITRIKQLIPKKFNFIGDGDKTLKDGFLAHEVSSIVPEAITGTKDEVDSDNNPVYQAIDQSKLVPLLTAALQEAITKIETLETKVAALEAK